VRWREEREEAHEAGDDDVKRWKNDAVRMKMSAKWKRCMM